jgi:aspartyl-tRNA(Asn)/glutamyl-tRNA(Gln) amidotransferase subunit A
MAAVQATDPVWRPFPVAGATATVEACLERIRALNPVLNALITVDEEAALERARECDDLGAHGQHLGVLHGMPVVVKDNIDAVGFPTSSGSPAVERHPETDATAVARLRAAGAVIVGKANLDEFALGAMGINAHFGRCRNPWDPGRVPGGSSGGSAVAVAAALCIGALGTDTSGSVRTPAALNGLVGLRPSKGRVPLTGTTPVSPFFDTVGPMARSAVDVLRLFLAIAGDSTTTPAALHPQGLDVVSAMRDLVGLRIGVPKEFFFEECHPQVEDRVRAAIQVLQDGGATVVEVDLPDAEPAHAHLSHMMLADAYQFHHERLASEPATYGPDVRRRILAGKDVSGADYSAGRSWAAHWSSQVRATFRDVDVLISPTVPRPAPCLEDFADTLAATAHLTHYSYAWTLADVPIISVPCGFVDGLPVGMQVIADHFREDLLLRVAVNYQHATTWHQAWPDMIRTGIAETTTQRKECS